MAVGSITTGSVGNGIGDSVAVGNGASVGYGVSEGASVEVGKTKNVEVGTIAVGKTTVGNTAVGKNCPGVGSKLLPPPGSGVRLGNAIRVEVAIVRVSAAGVVGRAVGVALAPGAVPNSTNPAQ